MFFDTLLWKDLVYVGFVLLCVLIGIQAVVFVLKRLLPTRKNSTCGFKVFRQSGQPQTFKIIEKFYLDPQRYFLVILCFDQQYLFLIEEGGSTLLSSQKIKEKAA